MHEVKIEASVDIAGRRRSEERTYTSSEIATESQQQSQNTSVCTTRATCIISSSPLAAQYLVLLLRSYSGLNPMVAEDFLSVTDEIQDPIFILDCACLTLPSTECLRKLNKRFRNARFIVIDNIQTEEDAVSRVALGVHGIVEYSKVGAQLEVAVHAVAKGRLYLSEGVLEAYVRSSANPKRSRSLMGINATTPREREILELVRRRLSNKEIAHTLGVQESTVKFHLGNILGKLQLQSRYDLSRSTKQAWERMLN